MSKFCMEGVATSVVGDQKCVFPNMSNGGILSDTYTYIKDSSLVWISVAKCFFALINDPKGTEAVSKWVDALRKLNIAMIAGDEDESFRVFDGGVKDFRTFSSYLSDPDLSTFNFKVCDEFEAVLKTKNMKGVSDYLVTLYSQLKEKLGCKCNEGLPVIH